MRSSIVFLFVAGTLFGAIFLIQLCQKGLFGTQPTCGTLRDIRYGRAACPRPDHAHVAYCSLQSCFTQYAKDHTAIACSYLALSEYRCYLPIFPLQIRGIWSVNWEGLDRGHRDFKKECSRGRLPKLIPRDIKRDCWAPVDATVYYTRAICKVVLVVFNRHSRPQMKPLQRER